MKKIALILGLFLLTFNVTTQVHAYNSKYNTGTKVDEKSKADNQYIERKYKDVVRDKDGLRNEYIR